MTFFRFKRKPTSTKKDQLQAQVKDMQAEMDRLQRRLATLQGNEDGQEDSTSNTTSTASSRHRGDIVIFPQNQQQYQKQRPRGLVPPPSFLIDMDKKDDARSTSKKKKNISAANKTKKAPAYNPHATSRGAPNPRGNMTRQASVGPQVLSQLKQPSLQKSLKPVYTKSSHTTLMSSLRQKLFFMNSTLYTKNEQDALRLMISPPTPTKPTMTTSKTATTTTTTASNSGRAMQAEIAMMPPVSSPSPRAVVPQTSTRPPLERGPPSKIVVPTEVSESVCSSENSFKLQRRKQGQAAALKSFGASTRTKLCVDAMLQEQASPKKKTKKSGATTKGRPRGIPTGLQLKKQVPKTEEDEEEVLLAPMQMQMNPIMASPPPAANTTATAKRAPPVTKSPKKKTHKNAKKPPMGGGIDLHAAMMSEIQKRPKKNAAKKKNKIGNEMPVAIPDDNVDSRRTSSRPSANSTPTTTARKQQAKTFAEKQALVKNMLVVSAPIPQPQNAYEATTTHATATVTVDKPTPKQGTWEPPTEGPNLTFAERRAAVGKAFGGGVEATTPAAASTRHIPRTPPRDLLKPKSSVVARWNKFADLEEEGIPSAPRQRTKVVSKKKSPKTSKAPRSSKPQDKQRVNLLADIQNAKKKNPLKSVGSSNHNKTRKIQGSSSSNKTDDIMAGIRAGVQLKKVNVEEHKEAAQEASSSKEQTHMSALLAKLQARKQQCLNRPQHYHGDEEVVEDDWTL